MTRLLLQGKTVEPEQYLTIVLNNDRALGGGGFSMFAELYRIFINTTFDRYGILRRSLICSDTSKKLSRRHEP